jgi:Cytochrome c554 and c-prime
MRHALSIAADSEVLRTHPRMTFRVGAYSYEIVSDGQQNSYRVTDGKETISEPILYAFGNAHVAQTYVYRHNGKLYEGRVSYYTAIDGLDWTVGDVLNPLPSLEEAAGRDINSDEARNCFSCHGTAAVVNTKLQLDRLIPGVTCEACHGPGGRHAAAMLFAPGESMYIFNPKALDAESLSQEFCGACHRGVDTVAMMPDLGGINNVRFQPYRLFNSRGHDPRDARLACTACHDPHLDLKQEDAVYDRKCTACHASRGAERSTGEQHKATAGELSVRSSTGKSCPVASERCVSCHMPKVELPGAHFKFTDHRIRIPRQGEAYPY